MSDYTYQDMMRMQSDARRRVFEMQKRSKDAVESFNSEKKHAVQKTEAVSDEPPRAPRAISFPAELPSSGKRNTASHSRIHISDIRGVLGSVFGRLTDDDYEKMFILSLCLLLTKDGADDSLILSLMYLLS